MNFIYKYRIPFKEISIITLPQNSKIIRIDGLDGALWLWAIVDINKPLVERTFYLYKTGGKLPDNIHELNYLGCGAIFIQMELMMYIFEVPNSEVLVTKENILFDWKKVQEL